MKLYSLVSFAVPGFLVATSAHAIVNFASYDWYSTAGGGGSGLVLDGETAVTTIGTSSASYTTYFAAEGSEISLLTAGDSLSISWSFIPSGVNATNTSQSFRLMVGDSPDGSRLVADGAPGSAAYSGYALFMNMGETTGHANSFELKERGDPLTSSAFLSSSGSWVGTSTNGLGKDLEGFLSGNEYLLTLSFTRTAENALQINSSILGGNIGGTGEVSLSYLDTTPNGFSFDTFGLRPSNAVGSATTLTFTDFSVDVSGPSLVPEASALPLFAGLAIAMANLRRRRR